MPVPLRVRLSIAFTAILLVPTVLLGALAGRAIVGARDQATTTVILQQATSAVRGQVLAECDRLTAIARALAVTVTVDDRADAVTPLGASGVWALCGQAPATGTRYTGLAARVPFGGGAGFAYAVRPVDTAFLSRLSVAAGLSVSTVDASRALPALGPLPLQFGAPPAADPARGLGVVLAAAATAVLVTVVLGTWLGGLATRPLIHLAAAVDRVASGDLTARSRLRGRDEVGRIAVRLNQFVATMHETQRLAVTDPLTGLGNLRHLSEALRLEVERAARFRRTVGILLLDLDHFKEVNDTYGHRVGDAVLTEFARRIRGVVREVDLAFRHGGEEFAILLPETDVGGSLTAARRVGEAVRAEPVAVDDLRIPITVSIGVAVYPRHAGSGVAALEAADGALYAAKAAGRDTFTLAGGGESDPRGPRYPSPRSTGVSVATARTQITADG
jgi:diguanylate cyclase (GGDEF)-like protein